MESKRILLLLASGFETFEASVILDVFGWNSLEGDGTTKVFTCGLRRELESSFGHKWIVDFLINEINDVTNWDKAIDLAFVLLSILTGDNNSTKVKKLMGFEQ